MAEKPAQPKRKPRSYNNNMYDVIAKAYGRKILDKITWTYELNSSEQISLRFVLCQMDEEKELIPVDDDILEKYDKTFDHSIAEGMRWAVGYVGDNNEIVEYFPRILTMITSLYGENKRINYENCKITIKKKDYTINQLVEKALKKLNLDEIPSNHPTSGTKRKAKSEGSSDASPKSGGKAKKKDSQESPQQPKAKRQKKNSDATFTDLSKAKRGGGSVISANREKLLKNVTDVSDALDRLRNITEGYIVPLCARMADIERAMAQNEDDDYCKNRKFGDAVTKFHSERANEWNSVGENVITLIDYIKNGNLSSRGGEEDAAKSAKSKKTAAPPKPASAKAAEKVPKEKRRKAEAAADADNEAKDAKDQGSDDQEKEAENDIPTIETMTLNTKLPKQKKSKKMEVMKVTKQTPPPSPATATVKTPSSKKQKKSSGAAKKSAKSGYDSLEDFPNSSDCSDVDKEDYNRIQNELMETLASGQCEAEEADVADEEKKVAAAEEDCESLDVSSEDENGGGSKGAAKKSNDTELKYHNKAMEKIANELSKEDEDAIIEEDDDDMKDVNNKASDDDSYDPDGDDGFDC